jgi:hypothetical protein
MFVFVVLVVMQCNTPILETFLGEESFVIVAKVSRERYR